MIVFRNVNVDFKYESLPDKDEKEKGTTIIPEAPLGMGMGMYRSV